MRGIAIDEYVITMISSCLLVAVCGALTEMMFSDRTGALRDLLFGGITLGAFLFAWLVYVMSNYRLPERSVEHTDEYAISAREALGASRKETFTAQVLVMPLPQKDRHDPFCGISPTFYETERIIDGGRYRLEFVRSHIANGEPTLIVSEE